MKLFTRVWCFLIQVVYTLLLKMIKRIVVLLWLQICLLQLQNKYCKSVWHQYSNSPTIKFWLKKICLCVCPPVCLHFQLIQNTHAMKSKFTKKDNLKWMTCSRLCVHMKQRWWNRIKTDKENTILIFPLIWIKKHRKIKYFLNTIQI